MIPGTRFYSAYHLLCRCSSINISPVELGAKWRGIIRCFSISLPYYHIVSLVSHSNRSELRSPVEAGIRARVSVRAHHSSAHCQSQAPPRSLAPCLPGSGFLHTPSLLCTAQARHSTSPLPPPPCPLLCLCTVLRCLALRTAEVSHFFMASFVWLDLVKKGVHVFFFLSFLFLFSPAFVFCSYFLFSFFPAVSLFHACHSSSATAKYLPPFNIVTSPATFPYTEIVLGFSSHVPCVMCRHI